MFDNNLFIGTEANPKDRHAISVAESDRNAFDRLPLGPSDKTVTVRDRNTGTCYVLRRANCGLGEHCFCAAEIVPTTPKTKVTRKKVTLAFEDWHNNRIVQDVTSIMTTTDQLIIRTLNDGDVTVERKHLLYYTEVLE